MGLNALQSSTEGFKVLGVPSNIFGMQEPGDNGTEILNMLKYVRPGGGDFVPNFQLTEKVDVNGLDEHPLFTYLKSQCPPVWQNFADKNRLFYKQLSVNDIRWNFEKFLVNRQGNPVIRYSETVLPADIVNDIQNLLNQN